MLNQTDRKTNTMPLDSAHFAFVDAPATLPRLDAKKWMDMIRDYAAAKATRKLADAQARAAESQVKSLRAKLFPALSGAPSAVCGQVILTIKTGAPARATITLRDGQIIDLAAVQSIKVGGKQISSDLIASIYGGRAGSVDLDVAGVI